MKLENINKSFKQGDVVIDVLKNINFTLDEGKSAAILGESGSGKTTFLQIAGMLSNADSGEYLFEGKNVVKLSDQDKTKLRLNKIGFVYQKHHLLSDFTALENLVIPQIIAGKKEKEAKLYAEEILASLGLADRISHRPSELSGGQQQRVAIGRALVNKPKLLIADEPTGNLDNKTGGVISNLFLDLVKKSGVCLLMATHNIALAEKMDRVFVLKNGMIE
jgi:lipoprotein-releasing system ATP-binding protein